MTLDRLAVKTMANGRKRKVSLYFPADMIREMEQEAKRLERPYFWLLRCAWQIAHREVAQLPARRPPEDGRAVVRQPRSVPRSPRRADGTG